MIEARGVTKAFGTRVLWSGLSFTVTGGQIMALTGPSGCGKSTLLNCLGTLETVDAGTVTAAGHDLTRAGPGMRRRFRRDVLGYLFQNYALIENATIRANVAVAAVRRTGRAEHRERLDAALGRVGLAGRADDMVYRLSGGEQQRVALARLLVKRATVVLADEPTGALDSDNTTLVLGVLRQMADEGSAVVVATHDKQVESNCDFSVELGAQVTAGEAQRSVR